MNGEDVKFQNWFKISEIANDAAMWEMQAKTAGCSKWDSGFIKKNNTVMTYTGKLKNKVVFNTNEKNRALAYLGPSKWPLIILREFLYCLFI